MSMREVDFAGEVALLYSGGPTSAYGGSSTIGIHKWSANAPAELAAIVTALTADTTLHDQTIETRAPVLIVGPVNGLVAPAAGWKSRFGNDLILLINAGKAAGLTNAQMLAGIDAVVGTATVPFNTAVPYASCSPLPPAVGSVCNSTVGTWIGMPTSYTFQWKRDGATNLGTAANYTLVSADIGGHAITCVVTASNTPGSTAAPPSNAIAT